MPSKIKVDTFTSDSDYIQFTNGVSLDLSHLPTGIPMPNGDASQRPGSTPTGLVRYNSEYGYLEYFDGKYWFDISNNFLASTDIPTDDLVLLFDPSNAKSYYNAPDASTQKYYSMRYKNSNTLRGVNDPVHTPPSGSTGGYYTFSGQNASTKYFRNLNHGVSSIANCTLSIWLKMPSVAVNHNIPFWISDSANRMFFIDTRSDYNWLQICTETFSLNRRPSTSQSQVADGNWHHIVAMRNNSSGCSLYIDNVAISVSQQNGYGGWGISNNDMTLGASLDNGNFYNEWLPSGSGDIGPVMFWTRELTAAEINNVYNFHASQY
jgi:hypothetical protein